MALTSYSNFFFLTRKENCMQRWSDKVTWVHTIHLKLFILIKQIITYQMMAPRKQNTIITNIRDFLSYISHHDKLETSIIPIGDGVSVSVKL